MASYRAIWLAEGFIMIMDAPYHIVRDVTAINKNQLSYCGFYKLQLYITPASSTYRWHNTLVKDQYLWLLDSDTFIITTNDQCYPCSCVQIQLFKYVNIVLPLYCPTPILSYPYIVLPLYCPTPILSYPIIVLPLYCPTPIQAHRANVVVAYAFFLRTEEKQILRWLINIGDWLENTQSVNKS